MYWGADNIDGDTFDDGTVYRLTGFFISIFLQVRLDFLSFRISGPSLTNPNPPYGKCQNDRMAVFARTPNLGLSEGNLICGDMTGQHS